MNAALVIAAHGTRDRAGEQVCRELCHRVATLLPEVSVRVGFVELSQPSVTQALSEALNQAEADQQHVVVVPLMLGTGTHVRHDIPDFIDQVRHAHPRARIDYAPHLGPDPRLIEAVRERIDQAMAPDQGPAWEPSETTLVMVGRGAVVPEANADHVRLARMHYEHGGWQEVAEAFIQVTRPSLPEALSQAYAHGRRRLLVMGHWLFPGRLRTWTFEQAQAWAADHPDAEVRVAEVIGDCDELAQVVVERYQQMRPGRRQLGSPAYLAGLLLDQRPALVAGGGAVAQRRVPALVAAGARVRLVAPEATPALQHLASTGAIEWHQRLASEDDVEGMWYVQACTNDPATNRAIAEAAEARHTFCVRADDAWSGSAWTPATCEVGSTTVAVLSNRDPQRSSAVRDQVRAALVTESD